MSPVLAILLAATLTAPADFTGVWYRDDERSDDAEAKLEEAVEGYIKKVSRGKATVNDVDPSMLKEINRILDTFVQHAEELDITQRPSELVIDDGSERLRIYYLDDEKHERQMPNGTRLETTAGLKGSQVDVFMKSSDDTKVTETYLLGEGGDGMVLIVRVEDDQLDGPLVVRNVYTRAP